MSTTTTTDKPKRPLSEKQLAPWRLNAQKSTGPRTPEGKARSSQNARKHGFFTQTALLFYEAPEDFVALRDSYIDEYQPQSPTEMHFVMEMANARFRLRRVRGMEADLIQILITRELPSRSLSNGEMQAQAFRTLADTSHALHLLQRYEVMFRRQYERALRMLWEHRDRQRELSSQTTSPRRRRRSTSPDFPRPQQRISLRPWPRAASQPCPPRTLLRISPRLKIPLALARGLPQPHQRLPPTVREGPTVPPPAPQTLAAQHPPKPKTAILRNEPKPAPARALPAAPPSPCRTPARLQSAAAADPQTKAPQRKAVNVQIHSCRVRAVRFGSTQSRPHPAGG
jgi:hypothetical protein